MMIDISSEQLLTMAQAARLRPPGRLGQPTHPSTVYRWISRGIRGQRLEAIRIGGSLYTSREALQRFAERLTADLATPGPTQDGTPPIARGSYDRAADEELARLGF